VLPVHVSSLEKRLVSGIFLETSLILEMYSIKREVIDYLHEDLSGYFSKWTRLLHLWFFFRFLPVC
jgi:hypothetical protein